MNKKNQLQQLVVCLLYSTSFYFLVNPLLRYLLFVFGVILGLALLMMDENIFFKYYQDQPIDLDESADETQATGFAGNNRKDVFLMTRSTLFLFILAPLSFFIVSSTGSALGSGFVLGIMLVLVQEMWLLKKSSDTFKQRFLSQLKKNINASQIEVIVMGATGYFLLLNIWTALIR